MSNEHGRGIWKYDLLVLGAFAVALILGGIDRNSAEVTAKQVQAVNQKKDLKPEDRLALTHPLGCSQFIQKCDSVKCKVYSVCADRSDK